MARVLMNYVEPGAVALGLDAPSSEAVIRILAEKLQRLGYVRESFAEAVLAREAKLPTGLPLGPGGNVAVPHTDPEHVVRPGLALATLAKPVQFSNMEDPGEALPVRVVFLMALNDKDKQIDMLQEIAETIQDPARIDALERAATIEDVSAVLR